jgi:hypothetical protein
MRNSTLLALALVSGACAPQSATITGGSYTAFLGDATSISLARGGVDLEKYSDYYQIDCRYFDEIETAEALRLPDRRPVCGAGDDGSEEFFFIDNDGIDEGYGLETNVVDFDDDQDGIFDYFDCDDNNPAEGPSTNCDIEAGEGDGFWPPVEENWLAADGWHVVTEDLDPWRGEGVVTHEGDLLVGFHQRLPGGDDFWFQFAIDRFFQPTQCVQDDDGGVVRAAKDGDWIDEWSRDLERIAELQGDEEAFAPFKHLEPYLDGRMFYLNARGFQFNPDENNDRWTIPQQWASGAAQGKFSEEFVLHRAPLYGDPQVYDLFERLGLGEGDTGDLGGLFSDLLWYCPMVAGTDPLTNQCMKDLLEEIDTSVAWSKGEMDLVLKEDADAPSVFPFSNMRHINTWRAVDGAPSGFDGWGEMYYSYVVFSADSDLRIGGRAEGAFTLFMLGQDSNTRVMVQGTFEVPKIKKDYWVPDDLREKKREEAAEDGQDVFYCSN